MLIKTSHAEVRHFAQPDEVRTFPKGRVELVRAGGAAVGRAVFEPGWKWSDSVGPIAKTQSCEAAHFAYQVSGTMMVELEDGTQHEIKPGDVYLLSQGHNAWVVGNEPVVTVDFQGMTDYAVEKGTGFFTAKLPRASAWKRNLASSRVGAALGFAALAAAGWFAVRRFRAPKSPYEALERAPVTSPM